ncbi:Lactose transport system permease protein LacF [Paraburkholderia hiiakae]|uniref:Lactose transport system permease protein LacF n=1 Tax=Paraburkholderia hiiakae TaxID=1081782 RepID=A0ABM8NES1_9BURK|nr:sugar ABC transporter permease [Paraburkholderia hiiakae]CAD6520958.1 Lactose transport system permease protein LacF [Paraburkholderia hiiakae]
MNSPLPTTEQVSREGLVRDTLAPLAHARGKPRLNPVKIAPYLFLAPFFVLFAVFLAFPLLFSLYLSFQSWDATAGLASMKWVGLSNFTFTLTDPWFWKSLYNTASMAVMSGVPQHLIALPLAFFLQTAFRRWRNFVVGLYFLPFITSSVAIALIFSSLYSTDFGMINLAITEIGKIPGLHWIVPSKPIEWLYNPANVKPAVSVVVFWRYVGWNTVLYLSALQTIPKDIYEAARIDGANGWQQFTRITIPLLKPMIFFAVTLSIIGGLQLFEEPFILLPNDGMGTSQSGLTTAVYMYRTAFHDGDFGTASSIAWLLFITISALMWLNTRIFHRSGMKEEAQR